MRALVAGLCICLLSLPFLFAQEKEMEKPAVKEDARFTLLKGLVGDWVQKDEEGNWGKDTFIRYKLTAAGSALAETTAIGTPMEMLTVYHQNGDAVVMTHYCSMGNQPKMKADEQTDDKKLFFACDGVSNVKSHDDPHMHGLTVTFEDDDHFVAAWDLFGGGKVTQTHTFSFQRKGK
ncbi:MAG: hypothetical protein O7H41_20980 [Planctomycetota bacterium]|nr:hypothetical protein [Planctomycetota bacterium]